MKKQFTFYWLLLGLIVLLGCQKEFSFELSNNPSVGGLQKDSTGDCLPKTVNGTYTVGQALVATTNTITVQVNVTKTGSFTVNTDTVNGYFFRATGLFTTLGSNTVTLRGNGTPFAAGVNNFVVSYDSTVCDVQVTVSTPAAFSLVGAPNNCTGAVVNGAYAVGLPLTSSNTAVLNVNVTTIGSFNITTTYQGMTFKKSGTFTMTGAQTVTLDGSGTPTTAGANVVPVTAGSSTCSFTVNVGSAGAGTLGGAPGACTPSTISGVYIQSTALDASDSVVIQVNVTTAGVFNISTDTVDGCWFSFSGNISATGLQSVTLHGNGTPNNTGAQVFTVKLGSSTCTFTITVAAADYFPRTTNSNWSYEFNSTATDSMYRKVISPTLSAIGYTYNIFMQDTGTGLDSSGYYRRSGGDYFEWFDAGAFIGFDPPPLWGEYIMLKDNVAVNTNWKSQTFSGFISGTPVSIRFTYTVIQKDVPISFTTSLGTMNFNNVIVVQEKYEGLNGSTWQDLTPYYGYGKSYYARGIGLVQYEFFDGTGTRTDLQQLRRYQVF